MNKTSILSVPLFCPSSPPPLSARRPSCVNGLFWSLTRDSIVCAVVSVNINIIIHLPCHHKCLIFSDNIHQLSWIVNFKFLRRKSQALIWYHALNVSVKTFSLIIDIGFLLSNYKNWSVFLTSWGLTIQFYWCKDNLKVLN